MKNINPIFLPLIIDSCSAETSAQLATGSITECLEGLTTKLFVAKSTFMFATLADFKDKAKWDAAIEARDIVPLYNVFEVASDNTEATKYESGNFVYTTKKEIKKLTSESYLSICSHKALKSYANSDYTQLYEVTEEKEALGVFDADGIRIKGQDISDFDVAIRERPMPDKPAYSKVTITFRDFEEFEDNGVIAQMDWDPNVLNGVFGLQLTVVSATATEVTFTAKSACGSTFQNGLTAADMELLTAAGGVQTITTLTNTSDLYLLSGTGLIDGTLQVKDVVTVDSMLYSSEAVAVDVTP